MKMSDAEATVRHVLLDTIASNTVLAGPLGAWIIPEEFIDALMKAMLDAPTRWAFMTYVNQDQEGR